MKKIGEMTVEEFKQALKSILFDKTEKAPKQEKTPDNEEKVSLEKLKEFFSTPLTKEVFIRRGKIVKAGLWEIISTVVFVVVAVILIRFFICEIRWIPSGSMKPTLIEGDRVLVNRLGRFLYTPKRGDVYVFYPKTEQLQNTPMKVFKRLTGFFCDDIAYIKRIIGMPGDKLEIKKDKIGKFTVYINDEPLDEPYIKNPLDYPDCQDYMFCGPFIVPEGNYFMMGDNRGNSSDSRFWGFLPEDRLIGKAVLVTRVSKL